MPEDADWTSRSSVGQGPLKIVFTKVMSVLNESAGISLEDALLKDIIMDLVY